MVLGKYFRTARCKEAFSYRLNIIRSSDLYDAKIAGNMLLGLCWCCMLSDWEAKIQLFLLHCVLARLLLATKCENTRWG